MSTKYSPERRTIGDLLSMTNPPILVPDWQRSFSWTTAEVEIFWQDLSTFDQRYPGDNVNSQEYFLGSVVLVDNNLFHLLLDGQQRLATSAILLSVIRDYLGRYNEDSAKRVSSRYLNDYDDASGKVTYKLTLNRFDRDFFKREILERRDGSYQSPAASVESHHLIRKAREFLSAKFDQKYRETDNPQNAHGWALRVLKVLTNHMSVVAVVSDDEDNAANVFETLNDRGIGLSTPDLLRNLVMRRAAEEHREEIIGLWGEILETEGDVKLKTFLRHYWISNEGDVKTQSLYREIKDHIMKENVESLTFSRELRDASVTYRDILAARDDDPQIARSLKDVNELGANVLYPAILSAYETGRREQLNKFLRALVVTLVRHAVIGRLETSLLETVVFGLARDIRRGKEFSSAVQTLQDFSPTDDNFTLAFDTVSISDSSTARYILREIEMSQRTNELDVSSPLNVHLEHIYPQTPRAGERWPNHPNVVNRLGNLTLLSRKLNTAIKNAPFGEKKACYKQSEINMTTSLVTLDDWTADAIDQRQRELSANAARIWAFPSGGT
ncbi:MAG: DUF262 domain-containing protein [Chloroflexi bacterium]|nr:DUF262 domain-containing protein [Chloroflexota bacterium]